ncbi:hypothetical protein Taro_000174, partial [Colocasia esculenta]|nr:hypothetical protein [Colocasia esculenta]
SPHLEDLDHLFIHSDNASILWCWFQPLISARVNLHNHIIARVWSFIQQSNIRSPYGFVMVNSICEEKADWRSYRWWRDAKHMLSRSHPPVVDHPSGGPSETNGRWLIALIYSDRRLMKFEPQDVTRSITKALLQYLPGPIAQWKEYPMETSHHFATERDVADARTTWNKITANRFTDYLNKHKAAAKKASENFDDLLMWKGHGPPTIMRGYWDAMCDKWATEDFRHHSRIAAENRTKMLEATLHTSGSISFGRQKEKSCDFVSEKAKEVMESYAKQMVDRRGGDSTQQPEFDAMAWLAAAGQPKKGRVFGFGSGLDVGGVISSSRDSHGSTIATTPPHSSTLPNDQVREVIFHALNNWLTQSLVPTLQTMGVGLRSPASVASSGASHVPPIRDPTIEAHQVERAERDDAEDADPRIQDD